MEHDVRAMRAEDYDEVLALWRSCAGIGLSDSDSRPAIEAYLVRNPGVSAIARDAGGRLVGAVLCGDDGRRGYLHHLAVSPAARRQGIAARLLDHCFARLASRGIPKCNIFVFRANAEGLAFWEHAGWSPRGDLTQLQKPVV